MVGKEEEQSCEQKEAIDHTLLVLFTIKIDNGDMIDINDELFSYAAFRAPIVAKGLFNLPVCIDRHCMWFRYGDRPIPRNPKLLIATMNSVFRCASGQEILEELLTKMLETRASWLTKRVIRNSFVWAEALCLSALEWNGIDFSDIQNDALLLIAQQNERSCIGEIIMQSGNYVKNYVERFPSVVVMTLVTYLCFPKEVAGIVVAMSTPPKSYGFSWC